MVAAYMKTGTMSRAEHAQAERETTRAITLVRNLKNKKRVENDSNCKLLQCLFFRTNSCFATVVDPNFGSNKDIAHVFHAYWSA